VQILLLKVNCALAIKEEFIFALAILIVMLEQPMTPALFSERKAQSLYRRSEPCNL
jgi:hypothetical protein